MKQFILFFLVLLPVCAFAQFVETFDGPEIGSVNPWIDDSGKYVINTDKQLQFDGSGLTGNYPFHAPVSYSTSMEWEMDVAFSFKPSNFNKACIYVYRTDVPSDILYYVQVGGNDDNVSFYKWPPKGGAQRIIAGTRRMNGRGVHVKLVLEESARWILYTRMSDEGHYTKEGELKDQNLKEIRHAGSLNIICYCKAKSLPNMFFYFDNLIVRHELTDTPLTPVEEPEDPSVPDITLPTLVSLEILNLSELQFVFDLPVRIDQAEFSVSGIGKASKVSYADNSRKMINAAYLQEMTPGEEYTISYSGVTDEKGNRLDPYATDVILESDEEQQPASGSVLINEVMADPKGVQDLPETEYVELCNTTDDKIILAGCLFSYGENAKPMSSFEIPANGYAVLYRSGRDVKVDPLAIKVPLDNFPSALANTGKLLKLLDASGNLIDEVTYQKATPGKSWERSSDGWHLSSDSRGGTPGSINSSGKEDIEEPDTPEDPEYPEEPDDPSVLPTAKVEPKEFVFNELLPNPFAGGSEYIELYNRSGRLLSLSGLSVAIRKTDGTLSTRYPLSVVTTAIDPEGYALLTKSIAGVTDFYTQSATVSFFEIPKLPILANTSSTLVLFRTEDGMVIDEVSYSSKWHASSIKDQKGVALERLNSEVETQSAANWTSASSTAGYGTPGYRNSQSETPSPDGPDEPTGIEAPEWVPGSEHYKITYYLDLPGYSCRAFVFNTAGQRVAEIANHELLGLSGQLIWDGSSLVGNRLRTGVYIFYAELYHISGQLKTYKKVFFVR